MSAHVSTWHVETGRDNIPSDIKNGEPIYGSIVDVDDFIIARVWSDQPDVAKRAALLAAAPGLLAELQRAADTFADFEKVYRVLRKPLLAGSAKIAGDSARAAIARAKGEA